LLYFGFSAVKNTHIKQVFRWVLYLAGALFLWAIVAALTSLLRHL
jgi:hypothetical protein